MCIYWASVLAETNLTPPSPSHQWVDSLCVLIFIFFIFFFAFWLFLYLLDVGTLTSERKKKKTWRLSGESPVAMSSPSSPSKTNQSEPSVFVMVEDNQFPMRRREKGGDSRERIRKRESPSIKWRFCPGGWVRQGGSQSHTLPWSLSLTVLSPQRRWCRSIRNSLFSPSVRSDSDCIFPHSHQTVHTSMMSNVPDMEE